MMTEGISISCEARYDFSSLSDFRNSNLDIEIHYYRLTISKTLKKSVADLRGSARDAHLSV